jgi:hypothetical protein
VPTWENTQPDDGSFRLRCPVVSVVRRGRGGRFRSTPTPPGSSGMRTHASHGLPDHAHRGPCLQVAADVRTTIHVDVPRNLGGLCVGPK